MKRDSANSPEPADDGAISLTTVIFLAGTLLLGTACLVWVDWLAGALFLSIGIYSFYLVVKRVATARLTARRRQQAQDDE